jgi:hypothetical protein
LSKNAGDIFQQQAALFAAALFWQEDLPDDAPEFD